MNAILGVAGAIAGLTSLVCWILTIVKAFKEGQTSTGVLSICGIIGFILGWINVKEWDHMPVMLAWTAAMIVSIVAQVVLRSAAGQM